jgi:hypothetical protein
VAFLSGIGGALGGVGLGDAIVAVAVDTSALSSGLEKAKGEVAASTSAMSAQAKAIGTGFIIAGAAAVIGIGKAVSATQQLALETRDLQRVTGLTAEAASGLLFVTEGLGIATGTLESAFKTVAVNIAKGSDAFAKYGIETKNADGTTRSLLDILGQASDKFVELGGGMKGTALATAIFGRSGKELIGILEQGSVSLEQAIAEADKYGVVLGQDTVDDVVALVNAHANLNSAFQGLEVAVGTKGIPVLTTFTNAATDLVLVFDKIPGPVLAIGGALVAMTGFLYLGQRALALLGATWTPVIAAFGFGTKAIVDNTVAVVADTGAMKLFIANSSGVVVAEKAIAGAAVTTTAALEGEGVAATGLLGKLGLLARGGATGIGGLVAPFNVALPQTSAQESGEAQALIDQANAQHNSNDELARSAELLHLNAAAVVKARTENISYDDALAGLATSAAGATGAVGDLAAADQDAAAAADAAAQKAQDAAAAFQAMKNATQALAGGMLGLIANARQLKTDQQQLNKMQEHGIDSGRRYNDLLLQILGDTQAQKGAIRDYVEGLQASGKSQEYVNSQLDKMAGRFGISKNAVQALIDKVFGLKNALDGLHDKTVTVTLVEHHQGRGGVR